MIMLLANLLTRRVLVLYCALSVCVIDLAVLSFAGRRWFRLLVYKVVVALLVVFPRVTLQAKLRIWRFVVSWLGSGVVLRAATKDRQDCGPSVTFQAISKRGVAAMARENSLENAEAQGERLALEDHERA